MGGRALKALFFPEWAGLDPQVNAFCKCQAGGSKGNGADDRKEEGKERGKKKAQIWRWEGMIGNSVRLTFVWFFLVVNCIHVVPH